MVIPTRLSRIGKSMKSCGLMRMAVEMWVMAMGTARGRRKTLRLDMEVMCVFVYRQNANACQSENIQEPLSPQIILHKKFSAVAVVPVARERRLQRAYSTHFRDVGLLCWSVKTHGMRNEIL